MLRVEGYVRVPKLTRKGVCTLEKGVFSSEAQVRGVVAGAVHLVDRDALPLGCCPVFFPMYEQLK